MLWSWVDSIVGLVAQYPAWAMAIAFAGAIIEAVAVVGILVPGTPILMAVTGAAAASGQPMLPYLVLAVTGAVIGDFLSYWFGVRYAHTLRTMWPFSRRPELLVRADWFFDRYGTASVALCRFLPVLRSTVPLVAGMTGMRRRRFVMANVASAFVWAPAHVYPAQFAGLMLDALRDGDWVAVSVWGGMLGCCAAAVWVVHRLVVVRAR
jgi:membrane protein DedA with SNARE-associated domain